VIDFWSLEYTIFKPKIDRIEKLHTITHKFTSFLLLTSSNNHHCNDFN